MKSFRKNHKAEIFVYTQSYQQYKILAFALEKKMHCGNLKDFDYSLRFNTDQHEIDRIKRHLKIDENRFIPY